MRDAAPDAAAARPLAIAVMGPTAAGKTELALALAARLRCTIISVDSALIYRGMDIGTAKPSAAIQARFPHRLIDVCEPTETYSAARFRADALAAMAASQAAGRLPLLVGGTMLYFRALQQGLAPLPDADPTVRAQLDARLARDGAAALHRWLAEVDPPAAARIHPHDPQRVQRALEVWLVSGEPMSRLWQRAPAAADCPYRLLKLVRAPRARALLHERIARRFDAMLAAGLEQEVAGLWARGDLTPAMPSMRCVGYRQMLQYLRGELDFAAMRERAIIATRQLAKRQFTWLRAEPDCLWLDDETPVLAQALAAVQAAGGLAGR